MPTNKPTYLPQKLPVNHSRAAFDQHFAAPEYAEFQAMLKAEDIVEFKDPLVVEIRVVEHVAGFM